MSFIIFLIIAAVIISLLTMPSDNNSDKKSPNRIEKGCFYIDDKRRGEAPKTENEIDLIEETSYKGKRLFIVNGNLFDPVKNKWI